MKKALFLITSLLAISVMGTAGCMNGQTDNGNHSTSVSTSEIVQDNSDNGKDGKDGGCKDGNCKDGEKAVPDFVLRPHRYEDFMEDKPVERSPELDFRTPHKNSDLRTVTDEDDGGEEVKPPQTKKRMPHKKHRRGNEPVPEPRPAQPRTLN